MFKKLKEKMDELKELFGENAMSVIMTDLAAIITGLIIITLCFFLGDNLEDYFYNVLITILGMLLGWALGMFFAPYDKTETDKFTAIGQSISAFVSGYVVSKLDRFLEATMFVDKLPSEATWTRLGLFCSSLVLTVLTVFSNRKYFSAGGSRDAGGGGSGPSGAASPSGSTTTSTPTTSTPTTPTPKTSTPTTPTP